MFRNYLVTAFRNIKRQKLYSFTNIFGLSIGIAACLFIFIYVRNELSYDMYHRDADRIFRIGTEIKDKTGDVIFAAAHIPLAPAIKKDFPQVGHAVRFWGGGIPLVVRSGKDKKFYEKENYFRADPELFEIFTIPFIVGNPKTALSNPQSVVISEDMAEKYFGRENPLGKTLNFDKKDWEITGVFKNIPHNSHLPKFQFVTLLQTPDWASGWDGLRIPTYVKLKKHTKSKELENQIRDIAHLYAGETLKSLGETRKYFLQPIKDIHLHSNFLNEYSSIGSIKEIAIFSALSLIILFIACLNFINLTTACSTIRTKEIGIRKVVGANKKQLIVQFLGESIIISTISLALALIIIETVLPLFNKLLETNLNISYFSDSIFLINIFILMIFVGVVSGSYPAFLLASFRPEVILRNLFIKGSGKHVMRKILVILQFVVASILIIGVLVIYQQLHFMKNKDLGFDKKQMLILPMQDQEMIKTVSGHIQTIKNEFTDHPSIISATAILRTPGRIEHHDNIRLLDENTSKIFGMNNIFVDHDFIDTYNIGVSAGRAFKKEITTDVGKAFMINETAVLAFGWTSPQEAIGKRLSYWMGEGEIIGVCKDFHLWSLHRPIEPLFFLIPPKCFPEVITLKLDTNNFPGTLGYIKEKWMEFFPDYPLEYYFLEDDFNRQYHSDEIFNKLAFIFTMLAIFVACIGLFSLASFTTEQRTKEIGIRKVLGASVPGIVFMLSKEFLKWVVIATVIAWPIAYYAMNKWLQNYAYRIEISPWLFVLAGLIALIIALLTVSFQAVKAAGANPVESLRYE